LTNSERLLYYLTMMSDTQSESGLIGHKTLRITPAMESRLTDHVWTIQELLS
jgi:hypothetical protein